MLAILFSLLPIGVIFYFEGLAGLRILLPIAIYTLAGVVAAVTLTFLINLFSRQSFLKRFCQIQRIVNFVLCLVFLAWAVLGLVFKLNPPQ